jgi:hypothetical protein
MVATAKRRNQEHRYPQPVLSSNVVLGAALPEVLFLDNRLTPGNSVIRFCVDDFQELARLTTTSGATVVTDLTIKVRSLNAITERDYTQNMLIVK